MASRVFALFLSIMAVSLISINCNGLRTKSKLQNVFSHFNLRKFDIICLQETFWDDNFIKSYVKYQWDGEIYYSNSDELHYSKVVHLDVLSLRPQTNTTSAFAAARLATRR